MEIWIMSVCIAAAASNGVCQDNVRTIRFSHEQCTALRNAVIEKIDPKLLSGRELICRQMEVVNIDQLPPPTINK